MRIHPVQRKAFLDVKFVVGIIIENDLGEQPLMAITATWPETCTRCR
jgi:hypothetical protein